MRADHVRLPVLLPLGELVNSDIQRLDEKLEQRVIERTRTLVAANRTLKLEIDERKRVEEDLQKTAADLAEAQRMAKLGNWSFDLRTHQVSWSDEIYRIFEIASSDFDGRYDIFVSRVHPDDRARVVRQNAQTSLEGSPFDIEYRIVTPNNQVKIIQEIGYAARDEAGNVIRVFGTAQDITDRKQVDDDLRRQKEILQQIFDHIPVMINFVDAEGGIELVNREWERTLGWSLAEIRQQNLDVFAACYPDPQYRQQVLKFVTEATGEWVDFKTRVRDGRVMDTAWVRVPMSDGTSLGIGTDITERKQAEEALRDSEERFRQMAEQFRALSARLRSAREEEGVRIARELHDELGSVLTSLKLDFGAMKSEQLRSTSDADLSRLRAKIDTMMQVVDHTIDTVRRISSELRPSILDDIGLMAAIRWQAKQFEAQAGIACRCDCCLGDVDLGQQQSTAIFRVFQEALTNVRRHAQATTVSITMAKENDELVLTIRDNGRGITADEESDRLSLGLVGMRERITLVGGTIHIAGVEGKGTVIAVRLPSPTPS